LEAFSFEPLFLGVTVGEVIAFGALVPSTSAFTTLGGGLNGSVFVLLGILDLGEAQHVSYELYFLPLSVASAKNSLVFIRSLRQC
jgi:hypothetical protein